MPQHGTIHDSLYNAFSFGLFAAYELEFSVERLMEFLTALGQDVEITVRPTRREHGKMSVVVAA